ncbi:MAG TPA: sodium ion-translocating decarboxylase subunit beta [Candidatus Caccosoma faecigallinarum]|uniref:Sodium ion-translocating decarboxylase subunit beta n=1 Tax=Candidatus Caccosoma faecigallinarum TaxID=2840720 RepID=A0A9D1G7C6_9FIRM|nr:sodium ion-translocating decarboxylase subunit beta [Candidatus Caccosoma faecigallinarum]
MILIALLLMYFAIFKQAEPYLLIPISFGVLLVNLPLGGIFEKSTDVLYSVEQLATSTGLTLEQARQFFTSLGLDVEQSYQLSKIIELVQNDADVINNLDLDLLVLNRLVDFLNQETQYSGLLGYLYYGVQTGIYPCLIFLGIGATTDFGPLISNPKSMILGAAAQIGIFITFLGALLLGFTPQEASSIGIIGGADGPTAILVTKTLAPHLLSSISIAAYSYMALVPFIQPPIIRLLTTKKERLIKMEEPTEVSKTKRILFPIIVTVVVVLLIPSCAPLIGCLMLGNLIKETGVVPKLTEAAGNTILYLVTILLGLCVGATANAETFLSLNTIKIFALGIFAFATATAGGVLIGKLMCKMTKGKINPMIGAAGVSAVPMAARVVHKEGVKEDPSNFLLMHAMGPNVAGVIGSAVAAGLLMLLFGA